MRRDLLAALHDLGAGAMHEEELSHRMQDLFRDRIADKQDMLRRFRAGVSLTSVPAAETDATVDIPISFRDDGSVVDTSPATPARRASRFDHASSSSQDLRQEQDDPAQARTSRLPRAKWALAALAIGAAVSIGAAASGRFGPPAEAASGPMGEASETSPRQASRQASPSSPGEADPPAPPQSEPDVEHIVVHVESSPGGARVRIDGRDEGVTPLDLRLPRGKGGLKLELRREGFVTYTQSVVPDVDQKLLLSLRAVRGSGALPAAKPAAPAAPAKSGFRRFD